MERLKTTRARRWLARVAALVLVGVSVSVVVPATANAADASGFDPGFLIADEDFFASTALTASQADAFIDTMNKGCLTGRVCLENYKESIKAKAKNSRCAAITAASNRTAGQIIATVAKACGISPKAIIVILQKEQSLITLQAPSATAFQASMGAGCPDTAPCDGRYAGFYENVYYGAYLLKGYTIPGSTHYTRYQAGKTSSIAYSPRSYGSSPTCGFKSVYVQNQATHALYVYTPYTPNAAALKNLYGTGDSCSAYGNRNFWRLYTDWFGATGAYGQTEITEFWNSKGGASGSIGNATAAPVFSSSAGGGYYQTFEKGTISWTSATGATFIAKPFDALWSTTGIATAGWPIQSTYTSKTAGGGLIQKTTKGMMVQPNGRDEFFVTSGFRTAWETYGGPSGVLGWPHAAKYSVRSGLWGMEFDKGNVFHNGKKFGWVHASLLAEYLARGDVNGELGWPTGTYSANSTRGGIGAQQFEKGRLYASTEHGPHLVAGAHKDAYLAAGGPAKIGWPTSEAYTDESSGFVMQDFEDATIIANGKSTVVVANPLVAAAIKHGVFGGKLGAPKGLPKWSSANGGGVSQDFAGGSLAKGPTDSVIFVYGGLLTAWNAKGRESGVLGWPITDRYTDKLLNTINQDFQYGTVFHNRVKWGTVGTNLVPLARELGVTKPSLGWATSNVVKTKWNGGGQYQSFTKGTITWQSERGATYVPKVVWTTVKAQGGVSGTKVGWPTGKAVWTSKTSTWKQSFQFSTITCVSGKACTVKATS